MKRVLTREQLERRRGVTIEDLRAKLDAEDWHGVQDCASDIREIEAQLDVMVLAWHHDQASK